MKKASFLLSLAIIISVVSCSIPANKEDYIEKFGAFIDQVKANHHSYSHKEWQESDAEFKKFSDEWYNKFKEDLSFSDEVTIKGFITQYYIFKAIDGTSDFFEEYLRDDYDKLRKDVEYYIENNMEDDLQDLVDMAKEAGDSAVSILNEIIEDVKEK